ncbi:MAG: sulfotransferase family protein [Isosphaeraceae bacterium]
MMIHRPDFIVVGAMKNATTTLHEQLARQPGLFMCRPKEPNFFSDDAIYARGWNWYGDLFRTAQDADLRGEPSTHYTKLPTYPWTVDRMVRDLPRLKLIYVMRHPIDRLVSHYVHEVTTGRVRGGVAEAIEQLPELVEYGRYSLQLQPFLDAYGPSSVLPVFFPRLVHHSQAELKRIGEFLDVEHPLYWDDAMEPQNQGTERLRPSAVRVALVQAPVLTTIRQKVVPRTWSRPLKVFWRARVEPPRISPVLRSRLGEVFDADLAELGSWLGIPLDCETFHDQTVDRSLDWAGV